MRIQYHFIRFFTFVFLLTFSCQLFAQQDMGKIKCICIDAGHGGYDPGAINGKVKEKDITLAIALKLGALIKKHYPDIKVIYTRNKDIAVDLRERGKIANRAKAQLFISIHVNSVKKNTNVKGVETYVLGLHKSETSLQVAMKENEAIHYEDDYTVKYDGFDPTKTESYIMFNFMKNSFLINSMAFASVVQKNLVANLKANDREVRQAGFIVLMDVGMPSVLIETGFITNPSDLKVLTSQDGQNKIAQSVFNAFKTYKTDTERNSVILNQEKKAESNSQLFYAVQIASSKMRIKDLKILKLKEKVEELNDGVRFRYYVCKSLEYEEVVKAQQKMRKVVKDCFVIAVLNGKTIPVSEARKIEQK